MTLPTLVLSLLAGFPAAEPFTPADGDRVVLIGNTLIEREQRYGYWELMLTRRFPGRHVTFRNLGWSGDTVFGEARAGFDTPAEGFRRLKEHVLALEPTVLVLGYGGNEAFDGPAGLPRFRAGVRALLEALAPARARVVVLAPPDQEDLGRPLPDPSRHNQDLTLYREALKEIARQAGCVFVDHYAAPGGDGKAPLLTDDGLHLTAFGYWLSAHLLEKELGWSAPWQVRLGADGKGVQAEGARVDEIRTEPLRFRVTDDVLPLPPAPGRAVPSGDPRVLTIQGLTPGVYALTINGKEVAVAPAKGWAAGVQLDRGPSPDRAEELRRAIVAKNQLYFHRWRPQNETYLFGFRKHEQGQNAREIPQFDPLVVKQEEIIARLRVPLPQVYELQRVKK